jgi:hypothetical protein
MVINNLSEKFNCNPIQLIDKINNSKYNVSKKLELVDKLCNLINEDGASYFSPEFIEQKIL